MYFVIVLFELNCAVVGQSLYRRSPPSILVTSHPVQRLIISRHPARSLPLHPPLPRRARRRPSFCSTSPTAVASFGSLSTSRLSATMPSLRRTVSTPLVRATPYPSSLSASASRSTPSMAARQRQRQDHVAAHPGQTPFVVACSPTSSGGEWHDGQQPEEPELDEDQVAAAVDVPAGGDTLQNAVPPRGARH